MTKEKPLQQQHHCEDIEQEALELDTVAVVLGQERFGHVFGCEVGESFAVREVPDVPFCDDQAILKEGRTAVGAVQRDELLGVGVVGGGDHFGREPEGFHHFRRGGGQDHGPEAHGGRILHHLPDAFPLRRFQLVRLIDGHGDQVALDQPLVHVFALRVADGQGGGAVVGGVDDVFRQHQFGTRAEGREVHQRDVDGRVEQEEADGHRCNREADVLDLAGDLQFAERQEGQGPERQQDEVLDQALEMGQVDGFAEAAAVHVRILDIEKGGQRGKADEHDAGDDGCNLAPDARDEGGADEGLQQGHPGADYSGNVHQEVQVQEFEVFLHDEPGPHGVHELEDAREEEQKADQDGANSSDNSHRRL